MKLNDEIIFVILTHVQQIRAEYFSKFQHAIGIFYPKSCKNKPKWFKQNNVVINLNGAESKEWYNISAPLRFLDSGKPVYAYILKNNYDNIRITLII
jgi:hypothetical protein